MPTIVGGCAAADFPPDEACVRRQQMPVRALARRSFGGRHIESFAHLFDGVVPSHQRGRRVREDQLGPVQMTKEPPPH